MAVPYDVKHLIHAILKFFDEEQRSEDLSPDAIESLEVAMQCLESAYGVTLRDVDISINYPLPASLPAIFSAGLSHLSSPPASVTDREAAERLKVEGNEFMKQEQYQSAIDCYTRALQFDDRNAVYYCNRACAHSKAGNHQSAIDDCNAALMLDPKYSKAYGRKGLAHTALGQHSQARQCYKRALEMDPVNDGYRDNLRASEQSVREAQSSAGGVGGVGGDGLGGMNLGGMDLSSLLNNPALMNMATSMLSNPQMQSMMANLMSGAQGGPAAGGPQGISSLLQAGQQLAAQMQQANPDLVEQLRSQMKTGPDSNEGGDATKPDDDAPAPST